MSDIDDAQVAAIFDRAAGRYDLMMQWSERLVLGHGRRWATSCATGRVLELAVGTGLNLPDYAASTTVLGVDLSGRMLEVAQSRVGELGIGERVRLQLGAVQNLDVEDATQDTVVSTYTFCTIPDPAAAAREAFRVLRPGGRFLLVEHGPSTNALIRAGQRLVEPLTVKLGADHLTREPVGYLEGAGFEVEKVSRDRFGAIFRVAARKP